MEEQYIRDVQSSQRFPCPTCERIVTGLVRGKGHLPQSSKTHCCHNCKNGRGHDDFWCGGTPSSWVRRLRLKGSPYGQVEDRLRIAHYVLHEPDWQKVQAPVPAVLFLHGAFTYLWPETLWTELKVLLDNNQKARDCVVIAPYATIGEPLAVISERTKIDRFERKRPYVDSFDAELTWECFVGACLEVGSDRVDFQRLCVIGYSMGAQAAWEIAARHGTQIAAIAPIAARAYWRALSDIPEEKILESLRAVRIRQYAVETDYSAYNWGDIQWVASEGRKLSSRTSASIVQQVPRTSGSQAKEAVSYNWGPDLQLTLFRGAQGGKIGLHGADQHNCWDTVFTRESLFGLFRWFANSCNPNGAALARGAPDPNMADAKQLEADVVQESLLARACRRRDLFQVQALLRDKADPNERSAAGETPLLEAANGGDVNVVALLLGHGADVATRARPGFEADAERGLQQHIKVLFYIFRERGKSAVDRRAALERLPVALDPGALAHVYVKLGLGGRQCGGVRQGGMAPAEALVRRTPLREAESAADHDIVLHLADPLRPVLVANPLWQKPTATVVLLHGMLQSGQMMERMIRDLARTLLHVRFLAPTAPTLPTHGGIGPAWWNVLDRVPEGTPPRHWRQSTAELEDILEMEKENGMMPDRIVLAGFSLGGAMAISLALKAQQQFGGLVVMGSARVPSIWKASPNAAEGLPVLQVHGEDDHIATLDDALKSADFLRGAGCNVHFSTYSHVGHTVSAKMLEEIRSWLMECLPPDGPRKKVMHTSAADTKMEHTGAAETKMEQTGAAEPEVHIEVAETKTDFAADQRLEEEEPEAAEAEAGHTPEKMETCEIGQMHEDESLLNSRSTDTEAVDEDVSALHAKSEADTKSAAEVELPSSPPEPPLTDPAAAGLGQVDEEPDGISAPEKSVRIREDALALLLAYDIPLRACEEVLPRFDYDGDAALDFLMDSEEGQQFVLEIEKAGETEEFDTTTLPEGVPAFDISTPPDADNTDTMEMEGYDDEIDWGTLQYGADMPKAKRQTASSSTSSMDFWEDVVPEGTGDFSERQEHPVGEKGPNTPPLLEVETGSFEAQGLDTEATREQLGGVGITLEVDEASTPCISTLEAETSRHQPEVLGSTFNFDEESSPQISRQASGEPAEAFVSTFEPDLVAETLEAETSRHQPDVVSSTVNFDEERPPRTSGQESGEQAEAFVDTFEPDLVVETQEGETSRHQPDVVDSTCDFGDESSPQTSGQASGEQAEAFVNTFEPDLGAGTLEAEASRHQPEVLGSTFNFDEESSPPTPGQASAEQAEAFVNTFEPDPVSETLEAETSRHQPEVLGSTFNFDEESSPRTFGQASGEQAEAFVNTFEHDLVSETLEAETSRHQPDVAGGSFNFDEESSPQTSRQASGEQAEAFVNTLEPDLVADSAPKSSREDVEITEQPGAVQSALGVESVSDTSGQEQSRAAGVSRPAAESSPSAFAQEREASTEPRGVSSTSRVATEFSSAPRSDSQEMETGRDQGKARSESDFGVDTSASAQAENGRKPPETVNAVELDAESASVQQTQTDREGQEADRARSDSAHEPETCREQSAGTRAYEVGSDRAHSDSEHQPEICREQSAGTCAYEFGADRARSDSEHQPETCREQSAGTGAHEVGADTARSDSVDQAEACREQPADSLELGTESTPSTSGQESETSRSPLGPASSIFEFGAESTPSTSGQESEQPGVVGSTAEVAARGAPGASAKEADARAEQSEKGSTSDICADNHKLALLLAFNLPLEACRIALRRFDNDEDSALEFLVDTKEGQTLCAEALQAEAAGAPAAHATCNAGAERATADRAGSDAARAAPANSPSAEDPVDNGCKLAEADSVDCQPKVNGADDSTPFLDESSNGTAPVDSTAPASGPPAADAAADKSTSAEADAIGCQAKGERQASEHDPEVGAKSQGPVVPQPSREKPLALAIKRGNLLKVKKLLKRGEDANMRGSKGETPLFAAVRAGHATIVATLLLGKADPSIRSSSSAKAADLATKTEIRCLLELASGRKVGAREQRSAFAALSDCTPLLFQRFLKARGMQLAVSNVRSEHEWDLACLSVSAAVAA